MDIQEIRKYNQSCNSYKQKAADINAQIKYHTESLMRLCETLTEQLGVKVTPDNLEQLYKEREAKIANTIAVGNSIMANIKKAEDNVSTGASLTNIEVDIKKERVAYGSMELMPEFDKPTSIVEKNEPKKEEKTPDLFEDKTSGALKGFIDPFASMNAPLDIEVEQEEVEAKIGLPESNYRMPSSNSGGLENEFFKGFGNIEQL